MTEVVFPAKALAHAILDSIPKGTPTAIALEALLAAFSAVTCTAASRSALSSADRETIATEAGALVRRNLMAGFAHDDEEAST